DEFQDTSQMQWFNLIPLIDNSLASEDMGVKGSLMVVGDPKQSIYRWRGGKAEQFIELSKEYNPFSNPDKEIIELGQNYRSYSEVINFNNELFGMLSGEFDDPDYKDLYANHSRQDFNSKTGGYVNISFLPEVQQPDDAEEAPDKNQLYLEEVLQTIQKVREKGFAYRDIVLLTRKRQPGV